ncbi:hypothetical protein D5018_02290 [Parashewanella curva]|uniref:Uncharacterized protein n=1 Tax=Parashewanella curva TaxID=2338552 RepID=A0A3L8Q2T0_9GAMM|nr:hypothetical protein [Parashewanella curva]RLV61328.1 hypothetical protein D5018_02290 [Parashewanella curva]
MFQLLIEKSYQAAVYFGLISEPENDLNFDTVMLGEQTYKIKLLPSDLPLEQRFVVWLGNEDDITPCNFSHTTNRTKEIYPKLLTCSSISMVNKANSIAAMQEDDMIFAIKKSAYEDLIELLPILANQLKIKDCQSTFDSVCKELVDDVEIRQQFIDSFEQLSDARSRDVISAFEMGLLPFVSFCSLEKAILIWQESESSDVKHKVIQRISSLILALDDYGLNAGMKPSSRAECDPSSKNLQHIITQPPLRKAIVLELHNRHHQAYARRLFASNTEVLACDLEPEYCLPLLYFESLNDTSEFLLYSRMFAEDQFNYVIENLPNRALVNLLKDTCQAQEQYDATEMRRLIVNHCSSLKLCEIAKELPLSAFIKCLRIVENSSTKVFTISSLSAYRIKLFFQAQQASDLQQEFIEEAKTNRGTLLRIQDLLKDEDTQSLPEKLAKLVVTSTS